MCCSRRCGASAARPATLLAVLSLFGLCCASPIPEANVTSSEGLQEGSCALGDVVYMSGDSFPGADPCETCACAGGDVTCARETCAPRPGCKAVHRPDHCCPTYQCECEQEGRVYGNGEKLVDPADPCRVCYCQGGEVVCRRIACFVRDDCRPRLVPGRCCPEYDNCPLRGVSAKPGAVPSGNVPIEDVGTTLAPAAAPEKVKQEITIKEITPVSEIPVITEVKIKEIIPSPSVEVVEYPSSSKSPLIPREATTDKPLSTEVGSQTEAPVIFDSAASSTHVSVISTAQPETDDKPNNGITIMRPIEDLYPSKISLSTQDGTSSDIYPSNSPSAASTTNSPTSTAASVTTKAPVVEEEEPSIFDHNPAFPPIPDDLSVLRNHEEDITPEQNMDTDHNEHVIGLVSSAVPATDSVVIRDDTTTAISSATNVEERAIMSSTPAETAPEKSETMTEIQTSTGKSETTTEAPKTPEPIIIEPEATSSRAAGTTDQQAQETKSSPMLNLRSAIPTDILSVPSLGPDDITGELDEIDENTTPSPVVTSSPNITTTHEPIKDEEKSNKKVETVDVVKSDPKPTSTNAPATETSTVKLVTEVSATQVSEESTTSYDVAKSNIATEVTSQTELSSFPVETSDQNPPGTADSEKDKAESTEEALTLAPTSIKMIPTEAEPITISRSPSSEKQDNVETTEFLLTPMGSSETSTDAVEVIQISNESSQKSAAIINPSHSNKNSVLTDLINLVGDVASMSDHSDEPPARRAPAAGISESEELIPVNAVYKSRNNNININSITEVPMKSKNPTKSKVSEIEDEEAESITDPAAPSRAEPTTRRPLIDRVSADDKQNNHTSGKDIEIITKSYVPTIARRPTKVVMKKNSDPAATEVAPAPAASAETATDEAPSSQETSAPPAATTAAPEATPPASSPAPAPAPSTPAPAPATTEQGPAPAAPAAPASTTPQ
ncbi:unnamed protein product [Plutella xylostella]|uniref:(diamondback moth) hypothetical protein n=1 Tax=Plutella xylostella TaxID=51655 RepID=A0A8S4DCD8_PLUXY|nr:unnamed protein product [Plutella xylostella]